MAREIRQEIKFLEKNSLPRSASSPRTALAFGGEKRLRSAITDMICENLFGRWDHMPDGEELLRLAGALKGSLYKRAVPFLELLETVFRQWSRTSSTLDHLFNPNGGGTLLKKYHFEFLEELKRIMPGNFPSGHNLESMKRLPAYLTALELRAQRAHAHPGKDLAKKKRLEPFLKDFEEIKSRLREDGDVEDPLLSDMLSRLETMLEEYRIALFAPEIGTLFRISDKKIRSLLGEIRRMLP